MSTPYGASTRQDNKLMLTSCRGLNETHRDRGLPFVQPASWPELKLCTGTFFGEFSPAYGAVFCTNFGRDREKGINP